MWKAKLTQISDVDAGGYVEILFEGYLDGVLLYPYLHTICKPEQVEEVMAAFLRDLKDKRDQVEVIEETKPEVTI